jgi:hypothetical protein
LTEKKRITNDMLTIMRDERIIVIADWLKVRSSLKNWIKLYCVLKPGIMLLYKSDTIKSGQWVGTIMLGSCQLLERPSKKHGFCFKLFHPLERSIWASKVSFRSLYLLLLSLSFSILIAYLYLFKQNKQGPTGETYINVPYILLPTFYLIFRAPSEKIGQIWMDALELTLRSSHLLKPPPPPVPVASLTASPGLATQQQQKQQSSLGLTSSIFNDSKLMKAEAISTIGSKPCSSGDRSPLASSGGAFKPPLPPKLTLAEAEIGNSFKNISFDAGDPDADAEAKSTEAETLLLTDSDGSGKLNDFCKQSSGGEDIYYDNMEDNSSNDNIDDDDKYFEDEDVDDDEQTTPPKASVMIGGESALQQQPLLRRGSPSFQLKPTSLTSKEEAINEQQPNPKETKYVASPKEEFGEVSLVVHFIC